MSYKSYTSYLSYVAVCLLAMTAQATVFPPTGDSQLIARSDAAVVATVQSVAARVRPDGVIVTDYRLSVEEALKGAPGAELTVEEIGGIAGGRVQFIADSAVYTPGERVLAFLRQRGDGTYFTTSMTLGKFEYARSAAGLPVVVRSGSELAAEPARDAAAFAQFVRGNGSAAYFTDSLPLANATLKPAVNTAASAYTLTTFGSPSFPVRWPCPPNCTVGFKSTSADPGGGIGHGVAAWTNDPNANITLSYGGTTTSAAPDPNDNVNIIYLNWTGAFNQGYCDGSQACTIGSGNNNNQTFNGETFVSITDADILVQPGLSGTAFDSIITHELGHAIGLRHSNQGTPSATNALMNFPINSSMGANLQQWDRDAVDTVYGNGAVCAQTVINSTSGGGTIPAGTSTTLSVNATGTLPLAYQWYDGTSGDTSLAVGTNSASFTTPPINTVKNYWVKVTSTCGSSANSATITVSPQTTQCFPIAIQLQPQSQTVAQGGSVTLTVGHSGSPASSYQWYLGQSGDTSNPVAGANAQSFTTPALTQTTLYWVRVVNNCSHADSSAAVLTVQGSTCIPPTFTIQPSDLLTVPSYLVASANDATSYQWFLGLTGDESHPQAGLTPSNSRFVTQLYLDVLHRDADTASAAFGGQLDANVATRQQVAQTVLTSAEARTGALTDWYRRYLHRDPSAAEVAFWMPAFVAGATDEQLQAQILGSPEYFALAGSTNAAWLGKIYNDVLHRVPTAPEQSAFLALLGSTSRTSVAQTILTSVEARAIAVNGWFSVLRRAPVSSETASFVAQLAGGATDEQVRAQILASSEYFNFGSILKVLAEGGNYWVKAVKDCGSTNSRTAGVAMNDICSKPSIVAQSPAVTINVGSSPNLTVTVDSSRPVSYQWYAGASGNTSSPIAGANAAVLLQPIDAAGLYTFWVRITNACGSTDSPAVTVTVNCNGAPAVGVSAPPAVPAGRPFTVSVDTRAAVFSKFELQVATSADFAGATTVTSTTGIFSLPAVQAPAGAVRQYFRARGFPACGGDPTPYSATASTLITVPQPPNSPTFGFAMPPCTSDCTIQQTIFIPGFTASGKQALASNDTFSVTVDKPWMSVSPSSGPLPAEGTNVTLSIDTSQLTIGSTEGSVTVIRNSAAGKTGILGSSSSTTPVSISLVTPVSPKPKDGNAPLNTLLIPAIAHADGIGALFQSDVRLTNTAAQAITYQLTYTPSGTDGTQSGKTTTITVNAGETKALNDVVKNFFGSGLLGEAGIGTLEIRPTNFSGKDGNVNVSYATVAASRTYSTTATGTFGQFIPAVALANFLSKSDTSKISLQQVAESKAYRTNLGFVEGSGQNVDLLVTLFDDANVPVAQRTFSLKPYEHSQQRMSAFFGIAGIDDGRVEVKVTSDGGKVTAYASTLDNTTSDPLLVFPVDPSTLGASRFTIPGVAELNNGAANFHTDMRVFNGGSAPVDVTLNYVPTGGGASPAPVQITLQPGEVKAYDNTLLTLWNLTGTGGAVIATTDHDAPLVLTARTYSRRDDGGTLGQFIPGVASDGGIGLDDKPLQIVQLEQSPSYRTNVGFVELTGKPVTIEITGFSPDSKVAAKVTRDLAPGEYVQLGSLFTQLGFGNVYNGRVSVKVIGGEGRVAAYGSNIDNRTQDPTFIPAQ